MHIAAANPQYVSSDQVSEEVLEEEKDIIRDQFKESNKPPEILEKIVQGKLGKFYAEVCLLNQIYIKDDKMTVEELIASYVTKFGENIRVRRFARFTLGES
jgi:elongation factor Ts